MIANNKTVTPCFFTSPLDGCTTSIHFVFEKENSKELQLKLFITTDVLIKAFLDEDNLCGSKPFLNALIDNDHYSPWVSALSIYDAHRMLNRLAGKDCAHAMLQQVNEHCAIVPLRRSVFGNESGSRLDDRGIHAQISSASQFTMDYVIALDVEGYAESPVPVLTPTQFMEEIYAGASDAVTQVPFMDLKAPHHKIYNEIDDLYTDIIANTGFILGKYVAEFENGFARLQNADYCVAVSSGTDALHIALMALGIGPGDGVIVPVNTFIATAEAVSLCGAVPIFCDCDEYYNIDVHGVEKILTQDARTSGLNVRMIIPVHLYGQPARMDDLMALAQTYDVMVVEDACQAHLAEYKDVKVGNFGKYGAFSFYPGKNLGAFGEGGALITNDAKLYETAKMIRQHGEIERYRHRVVGHNYRMSALQGAALGVKLKYIEDWTEKRQKNAGLYTELLENVKGVKIPRMVENTSCVHHLYVIGVEKRDELQEYLKQNGIMTGLHYPVPLHLQQAYAALGYHRGDFPMAEKAADTILSLPMFPELTEQQIHYVCDHIKAFLS